MTVDVIIPVHYPDESFQKLLDRLAMQTYSIQRIIVINTDVKGYPGDAIRQPANMELYHVESDAFDHGGTRDLAARKSDADLMLFMTQDALPADRHLVEHLVESFENEQVAAAYARQLPRKQDSLIEQFTRHFNYPAESAVKTQWDMKRIGIKAFFCSNVCAMYRKSVYLELGGFLPQAIFNEDMIYASTAVRAGYAIAYNAAARVLHSHNYTAMQQFRRNFDNAVSHVDNAYAFEGVNALGEGKKLVKETALYLLKHGKPLAILQLVWLSGAKYLGFWFGKRYYKLPRRWILRFTMNRHYWDNPNG